MNCSTITHGSTKDVKIIISKETSQIAKVIGFETNEDVKLADLSGTKRGNV
jgi:RNA polymerase subunit RPABC4/transcription elongation factor Spt4